MFTTSFFNTSELTSLQQHNCKQSSNAQQQ